MKNITAEEALAIWEKGGHLTPKKAQELKNALSDKSSDIGISKGIAIFATIGAILIGLGVLLFVGSNWSNMAPVHRILVIAAGYALVMIGAHVTEKRELPRVAEALWFLGTLLVGANIFLLAQIFHFSLTYWQGPFLWMVAAIAMGYARSRKEYAALAVPLGLLALGWVGGGKGWFMDDQMQFLIDEGGLRPILPLVGVGIISIGLLVRNLVGWADEALMKWGSLLLAIPLIATTVDPDVLDFFSMEYTIKQMLIIGGTVILVAVTLIKAKLSSDFSKYALLAVTAVQIFFVIQRGGKPLIDILVNDNTVAFFLYVLLIFLLALLCTWMGVQAANRALVNSGILSVTIIILIQYFSWTFEMLHSSVAFILGGVVLIGLSIFMERTRRKLLATIPTS